MSIKEKFPVLKTVVNVFLQSAAGVIGLFVILGLVLTGYSLGYANGTKDATIQRVTPVSSSIEQTNTEKPVTPSAERVDITVKQQTVPPWGGPDLWKAVNERRQTLGVNPLIQKDDLCTIASIRLGQLLELKKLDGHEGFTTMQEKRPDLKQIFERYGTIAEFLAIGGNSAQETVSLWENTLAHKKILTGGEYVWGCIYAQNTIAVGIAAY